MANSGNIPSPVYSRPKLLMPMYSTNDKKGGVIMYTCTACSHTYTNEPFRWHGGDGFYCSVHCLPIGTLDEYEALSYSELLQYYRELINEDFIGKARNKRAELLFEVNELQDLVTPYLIEDGENFYIGELHDLFDKVNALREKWEVI